VGNSTGIQLRYGSYSHDSYEMLILSLMYIGNILGAVVGFKFEMAEDRKRFDDNSKLIDEVGVLLTSESEICRKAQLLMALIDPFHGPEIQPSSCDVSAFQQLQEFKKHLPREQTVDVEFPGSLGFIKQLNRTKWSYSFSHVGAKSIMLRDFCAGVQIERTLLKKKIMACRNMEPLDISYTVDGKDLIAQIQFLKFWENIPCEVWFSLKSCLNQIKTDEYLISNRNTPVYDILRLDLKGLHLFRMSSTNCFHLLMICLNERRCPTEDIYGAIMNDHIPWIVVKASQLSPRLEQSHADPNFCWDQ